MDNTKKNLKRLVEYFEKSCKKADDPFKVGVEIEHFIMDKKTGKAAPFKGERGVERVLELLSPHFPKKNFQDGNLVGLDRGAYNITLEPSCQFEISIMPEEELAVIEDIYKGFEELMDPVLKELDLEILTFGYNPSQKNSEMELIPKKRYEFMNRYFEEIGSNGRHMMRSTASTQVSIDFYSEEDFIKKFKSIYIIGPLLALMTDNTPVYDGEKNDMHIRRMAIWRDVDPQRVDIFSRMDFNDFGFKDYARFVYTTPLIVDGSGDVSAYTKESAEQIYCDKLIDNDDIAHILSMVFPMARLKNYIEIRNADSIPIKESLSFTAFIKGLYKNPEGLYNYLDGLDVKDYSDIRNAEDAVMKDGYDAFVYGKKLAEIAKDLKKIAFDNLGEEGRFLC